MGHGPSRSPLSEQFYGAPILHDMLPRSLPHSLMLLFVWKKENGGRANKPKSIRFVHPRARWPFSTNDM